MAHLDRPESARAGLCFSCVHARRVESARGALFYRCGYSDIDSSFAKYPQLPVHRCAAFERHPDLPLHESDIVPDEGEQ